MCFPVPASAMETAKPRTFLQGRIEQVAASNELSKIVLYKQSPKLDKRSILKSSAEVASYPSYLVGRWGGALKNVWTVNAPNITNQLPQYRVGNIGTVVMHFDKVGTQVKLLPTVIFFPVEEVPVSQSAINTTEIQADSIEAFKKRTLASGILRGVPTLPLAKFSGEGLTGRKFESRILHDSIQVLKPGVVEQDVVIGEWKDGAFFNYREFVSRFTWYGPDKIYAQVLIANFGDTREAISKTLLEGWMSSNWRPIAESIASRLQTTWDEVVRRDGIE